MGLLALGWSWAYASPLGSAADDDFHLNSIWCAWGDHETCIADPPKNRALVPDRLANAPCYALSSGLDARCTWLLTDDMVTTDRVNYGYNPEPFYATLRAFVGPDEARSALIMRFFNVAVAAGLLVFAMVISRPAVRRALALGWAACLVPVGVFFIASNNPSSWVIIGTGVFWAFLYTLLSEPTLRSRRSVAALLGLSLSAVVALGARSDSFYPLLLSAVAVVLLTAPKWRARVFVHWAPWVVGLTVLGGMAVLLSNTRAGGMLRQASQLEFPAGDPGRDQPNAVLKTLLELPSYVGAMFGGQAPSWSQRTTALDGGTPGYTWPGFTYGMGWTDVAMPAIVGFLALGAAAGLFIVGLSSYSRRKLLALTILAAGFVAQVLFVRALFAFQLGNALQPRYLYPLVLVLMCVALLAFRCKHPLVNRGQTIVLVIALAVANSVALRATIARYAHGQAHSYTQLSDEPLWWWPSGPSPDALWIIGTVAGVVWFVAAFKLAPSHSERPRQQPDAKEAANRLDS